MDDLNLYGNFILWSRNILFIKEKRFIEILFGFLFSFRKAVFATIFSYFNLKKKKTYFFSLTEINYFDIKFESI